MKRIIIALVACAAVALAGFAWIGGSDNVSHAKTGKVATFTTPIVGGTEVYPHSRPWMVGVGYKVNGNFRLLCGGVIIGPQWVLTSASCLDTLISVEVVAGAHNLSDPYEPRVSQTSTNLLLHENYGRALIQNDIGLIRLPQPLLFNDEIQAINLDSSGNDWAGQVATMAGWGKYSSSNFGTPPTPSEVGNPIITNAECADVFGSIITPGIGCFSGAGGADSCNGDNGGPVFIGNTLVGIISFGSSAACGSGYPTGFTRVAQYRQWITQKTGI